MRAIFFSFKRFVACRLHRSLFDLFLSGYGHMIRGKESKPSMARAPRVRWKLSNMYTPSSGFSVHSLASPRLMNRKEEKKAEKAMKHLSCRIKVKQQQGREIGSWPQSHLHSLKPEQPEQPNKPRKRIHASHGPTRGDEKYLRTD